jgi:iron complex outermembrane recepter protein
MRGTAAAVVLLLILGAESAVAQAGGVRGVVRDAGGRELAGVAVTVSPMDRVAESGADGRFEVRLPAGQYRVAVSLLGYATASRSVTVTGGRVEAVEFVLRPTPLTLPGLQATASAGSRPPSAVTQATTQLSGRALDRALAGTIAQTLSGQPGVAVRFNGPGAAMPVLRGLTGDRVLMLQDGQRTGDLAGSAEDHGVTMDPLSAQRVEVVRGPATLLYGNNALGGVVNVISGDVTGGVPHRAQYGAALQAESAYPGGGLHARAALPLSSMTGLSLRAGGRTSGDMHGGGAAERVPNTHLRNASASVALSHAAPAWSGSVAARGFRFDHGVPAPPESELITLSGSRAEVSARSEIALPLSRFPHMRLDGTLQKYAHDELNAAGAVDQRFELGTQAVNLLVRQAAAGWLADGAWGAAVLQKSYTAAGDDALTPPADSRAVGIFGFQEAGIGVGGATLQLGGRFDRYSIASAGTPKFGPGVVRSFHAASGSAGLRVPAGAFTASLTAARSFRAPTVEELFSGAAHAGTGSVEYGNAALRAELGTSVEALFQVQAARISGQLAAYASRIDDYVTLAFQRDTVVGGAVLPVYVYTQSPAVLRGIEAALDIALTQSIAAGVMGDWLHAREADGTPLSFMPAPRIAASLLWDDGRWSAGIDAQHAFAQLRAGAANESPTAAYTLLRLDGGMRFSPGVGSRSSHAVSVRVENALGVEYREATSRIRDFAPSPGRNVGVVYRVHF